jgi:integrase
VTDPDHDDGGDLPALTPEIVADDVDLAAVVDRFMFENVAARDQQGEILQHQEVLRIMLEPEQWQAALQLEEITTANDRTIKRELGVLRTALALAKSRGVWSGDLDMILPEGFTPAPTPKQDTITRAQALRLFPHLSPDTAAATAFSLATGAELSGLQNALRIDIPDDLQSCNNVLVRGTKNAHRHDTVPTVTDEQKLLLGYAARHAKGDGGRLFGNLHRMFKELKEACVAEGIKPVSSHDLRRSGGQWMVDLSVPIELVSKFMRHSDTRITETIYASVKREDLADRVLDAIDPRYAKEAHKARQKPVIATLQAIPAPRQTEQLFEVEGVAKTLTNWSKASGIAKATLHNRVVTRGLTMGAALALGRTLARPRQKSPPKAAAECERVVQVSPGGNAPNGQKAPPSA